MIAFLATPIGRGIVIAVVIIAAGCGIWLHGEHHGAVRIQTKWDNATKAAIDRGEAARTDAERDVDRGLPDDKFDRD